MRKELGANTIQRKMFDEYWEFVQEYYLVEPEDEYWTDMIEAAGKLAEKYKGQFSLDLITAYMRSREREYALKKKREE